MPFEYRPDVLDALAAHGVRPTPSTPPALVKDHVTTLYLYELRSLRASMLQGEFPKADYANRVAQLRGRYRLMSLPSERWVEPTAR
ncbi:MAG: hypothetical protein QF463_04805 [Vicinamibacterales bacterium]|jgi:hypothetical protein|nr:hypothetical protein [Acidobacteriota bacterium]MDP6370917.1 hypothetical protein [Vicinamibacterales bacterium]MDP6608367.1 hypothetical protein [Vicinamibacterales bacterium]HAK54002.1 hypothetical protein [Acidobacteriota bacterium]|tara:strand:+ start:10741 stop:10998 length:258 start_codon:yes stop_codon:yes gene_type:complete